MQYAAQGQNTSAQYATTTTPEIKAGLLTQTILKLLEKVQACHEQVNRLEYVYGRLMNPRPAEVGKGQPTAPVPSTAEGYLVDLMQNVDALGSRLTNVATEFDKAI